MPISELKNRRFGKLSQIENSLVQSGGGRGLSCQSLTMFCPPNIDIHCIDPWVMTEMAFRAAQILGRREELERVAICPPGTGRNSEAL